MRVGIAVALALALLAASLHGRETVQSVLDPSKAERYGDPPVREISASAQGKGGKPGFSPAADENAGAAEEGDPLSSGGSRADLVGDFCYPADVPYYGISSKKEAGNALIRVLEATVRTRATSEKDLTLITRAFKAFYADHDALVLSFESLSGKSGKKVGEAYITNTAAGAFMLGMSDGPLNEEGISVVSYVDPAPISQAEVFARTECS